MSKLLARPSSLTLTVPALHLLGGLLLVGCAHAGAAPNAPVAAEPPVAGSTTSAMNQTSTQERRRIDIVLVGQRRPRVAILEPATPHPFAQKLEIDADRGTLSFLVEKRAAYELSLRYPRESDASQGGSEATQTIVFEVDDSDVVTLEIGDDFLKSGPTPWGRIWPAEEAERITASYHERLKATPQAKKLLDGEDNRPEDWTAYLETLAVHLRSVRQHVADLEDPEVRALVASTLLAQNAWMVDATDLGILPYEAIAWAFEFAPLDHPVWSVRPDSLVFVLDALGESRLGQAAADLVETTPYPAVEAALTSAQARWARDRGDDETYVRLLTRLDEMVPGHHYAMVAKQEAKRRSASP